MSYFELQQPDKAKKTFQQAYQLHQAKDAVLSDRHAVELARFRDEAVALLLGGTPKNLIEQAEQLARKGDWKAAADEFVRVLEIFPDDHWAWYRSAVLQLKLGNFSGYQQHCRKMLELFGQTGDAYIAERAGKICLIVPDALPGDKRPFQLAERAVSLNNRNPLFTLSLGIARYRDGQFRSCLKWLKDSETGTGYNTKNIYFAATLNLFRAMAHHRLKQTDQAQQSLAYSTKIIEERFPKLGAGWHDRLMCEIVSEEARKLIGEKLNAEQQPETPPVAAPKPGG